MTAEIQLIREMIDRAATYGKIETFECQKTAAMLRTAANVMDDWNRKMFAYEKALRQISNHDTPGPNLGPAVTADWMQQIAREVLK